MTKKKSPKADVINVKNIIVATIWVWENGTLKDQLSEKSAMCDLVGLILALCPH